MNFWKVCPEVLSVGREKEESRARASEDSRARLPTDARQLGWRSRKHDLSAERLRG